MDGEKRMEDKVYNMYERKERVGKRKQLELNERGTECQELL